MYIGFLACFHAIRISRTQSFQRNRHVIFLALVALKLLVSLISRLVACSARIVADKQTHRTTTVTLAAHARRGLISSICYIGIVIVHFVPRSLIYMHPARTEGMVYI